MSSRLLSRPVVVFLLLALGLVGVELFAATRAVPATDSRALSIAIMVDLVVGLPLLGYLFLSRRAGWSPVVAGPLFLVGLLLARLLVPSGDDAVLRFGEYLVLGVEGFILVSVVVRARALRRTYVEQRPVQVYGFDALRATIAQVVPGSRAADAMATEMATVGLGLVGWRRTFTAPERASAFPYLRRSGYTAVFVAVLVGAAVEAVAVHLLVAHWSPTAALVVTGLTVYSMVWLAGDYNAMRLAPHVVRNGHLHLRTGLRMATDVPLDLVERVRPWRHGIATDEDFVPFGSPGVVIELREPVEVRKLFGRRADARTLAVAVDDVAGFIQHAGA